MNLQQLTYFLAVVGEANFTRAAAACRVAQPALSQQIGKLEDELGARLFDRGRRGATLTAAGRQFLQYAQRMQGLLDEARQRVRDVADVRAGLVNVLCTPTVAAYWLPPVVSAYRRLHPGVDIRVQELSGCGPEDLPPTGAEVGIVQLDPRPPGRGRYRLHEEVLFVDELVLVVPAGHRLANGSGRPVPLASLDEEAFVLHKPPCGLGGVISRAFAAAGLQPRIALETGQAEAVCRMVSAGLGVGFMPRMAMRGRNGNLRCRTVVRPTPTRVLGLVWLAGRPLSHAASALVTLLREEARRSERDRHSGDRTVLEAR